MRRSHSAVPALAFLLMAGLPPAASPSSPEPLPASSIACEPGVELDFAARVVDISYEGARAKVTLDLVLISRQGLRSFRIFFSQLQEATAERRAGFAGRDRDSLGRESERQLIAEGRTLISSGTSSRLLRRSEPLQTTFGSRDAEEQTHSMRHTVVLEGGRVHSLLLVAEAEAPGGEVSTRQAHVEVNLDPEKQPLLLDGLVQFRARPAP